MNEELMERFRVYALDNADKTDKLASGSEEKARERKSNTEDYKILFEREVELKKIEKDSEFKERELELKERELDLKEKELKQEKKKTKIESILKVTGYVSCFAAPFIAGALEVKGVFAKIGGYKTPKF